MNLQYPKCVDNRRHKLAFAGWDLAEDDDTHCVRCGLDFTLRFIPKTEDNLRVLNDVIEPVGIYSTPESP